jgi:hypothetical protein
MTVLLILLDFLVYVFRRTIPETPTGMQPKTKPKLSFWRV